jgi:hypothetical protein
MTNFVADTADDFISAANEKFGGNNPGTTDADASYRYSFKDGKLINVSFTFKVTSDFAAGSPTKQTGTSLRKLSDSRRSTRRNTRTVTKQSTETGTLIKSRRLSRRKPTMMRTTPRRQLTRK